MTKISHLYWQVCLKKLCNEQGGSCYRTGGTTLSYLISEQAVMETVGRKVGDVKVLLKSRNIFRQLEGGGIMKKRNQILIVGSCLLAIGGSILFYSKSDDAGQDFDKTKAFGELTRENPYLKYDKLKPVNDDIYAKGDHITITDEELEWQTEVFKLTNSKVPEEDAFNFICKFKSLYYAATQNGFSASDEELDRAIEFNVETYEQMKKEGEVDALYEAYGGAKNYEDAMREVTRKSMTIEKYMSSLKEEYAQNFTEDQIALGELEEKWADKRMEIEKSMVEQENIQRQ